VAVQPEAGRVCFEISVSGVALPALAAHIHDAPAGVNGPIVVTLGTPDADGRANGCVRGVDVGLLTDIVQDPSRFYVNVHTSEHPDGAVRGQLEPAAALTGAGAPV
jgi:hypothetical protein